MPTQRNSGQFGNRADTERQASKGGQASPGQFGGPEGADPHVAGRKGGRASSGQFGSSHGADPHKAGQKGGRH